RLFEVSAWAHFYLGEHADAEAELKKALAGEADLVATAARLRSLRFWLTVARGSIPRPRPRRPRDPEVDVARVERELARIDRRLWQARRWIALRAAMRLLRQVEKRFRYVECRLLLYVGEAAIACSAWEHAEEAIRKARTLAAASGYARETICALLLEACLVRS